MRKSCLLLSQGMKYTMKIEDENYVLEYEENTGRISIQGSLRLNGLDEYAPLLDVLVNCMQQSDAMFVDLSALEFLNSSGIAMFSKFIIQARSKENFSLELNGSSQIPWQSKSIKNLQRLFPALVVTFH